MAESTLWGEWFSNPLPSVLCVCELPFNLHLAPSEELGHQVGQQQKLQTLASNSF